ncbi:unnamed protein product [Arabidopsis arenosa]|uniref:Uncharacterized protein n=1 Tax=Arabidopsis arenosa TaxID=38785 RepID=A0A8S2A1G8_ARAAE|nr:unnamed protein product [Arabidopsis arenosa]
MVAFKVVCSGGNGGSRRLDAEIEGSRQRMSNNSSQRRILFVLKSLESQNDSALEGKVSDFKISEQEMGMYQNEVGIRIKRRPPTDEKGGAACLNVLTHEKYFKATP